MVSFKFLHSLMDFWKNVSQFFQSRNPAFFTYLSVLALFVFAIIVVNNSPISNIDFPSRTHRIQEERKGQEINESLKNMSLVSAEERSGNSTKREIIKRSCNIFDGHWVVDDLYPLYAPGSCRLIDNAFNCIRNGRPDSNYQRLRWEPKGCKIPRLDGKEMLEILRGKRLVFVGDSLNRNMWESLVCILRDSLEDKKRVSEVSGRKEFRTEGFYAFRFADYNCSIEFVQTPFLVQEWEMPNSTGAKKETLRLDRMHMSSTKYRDADIIIFNTGHWWTHPRTSLGKNYYQEGNHVYPELKVAEAYMKALRTWAKWVDASIDVNRTRVFFRGFSATHFKGGQWNSGGSCNGETHPITNDTLLVPYPRMMGIFESVISEMKTPVSYLNITKMTDYRKDGHPSIFRRPNAVPEKIQDCSHWCLPGVPDAWNELLYASILMSGNQEQEFLQGCKTKCALSQSWRCMSCDDTNCGANKLLSSSY